MIEYVCPKCGGELDEICLMTYPPQYITKCKECGWSHTKQEEVLKIPYPTLKSDFIEVTQVNNPCANCLNHPINGGSGICNCTLGGIKITY